MIHESPFLGSNRLPTPLAWRTCLSAAWRDAQVYSFGHSVLSSFDKGLALRADQGSIGSEAHIYKPAGHKHHGPKAHIEEVHSGQRGPAPTNLCTGWQPAERRRGFRQENLGNLAPEEASKRSYFGSAVAVSPVVRGLHVR